ncbi:hypothetical protein V6N12_015899 [Hibiscus sabdariffa]|uniref:Uncharacterized protein n=1 Tax=Hibiscus sabdariffa TaxID=183260 RepID=A0ABR2DPI3_9ROSI
MDWLVAKPKLLKQWVKRWNEGAGLVYFKSDDTNLQPEAEVVLDSLFDSLEPKYGELLKKHFPDSDFSDPVGVASDGLGKKTLPADGLGKKKLPAHVKMDNYQTSAASAASA